MTRLGLLVEPDCRPAWKKWLLGLPGVEWRLVFHHRPSGKSVEVWVWFCCRRWVTKRCRKLGINVVGSGEWGFRSIPGDELPVNRGRGVLTYCLLEIWRAAMRKRSVSPSRARVVVAGDDSLGALFAQAMAEETSFLTVTGNLCSVLESVQHRALYETGVVMNLEREPLKASKGADAIIMLEGTDEDFVLGEHLRGTWIHRLSGTSPLMVRLPGKIMDAGGGFMGILLKLLSKALPDWVRGWREGVLENEELTLPADYSESLLLALAGESIGRCGQVDRLEYLHQIKLLGIDYQLTAVQLDFP